MIINRPGTVFEYDGVKYTIGETIVGTAESEYENLFGSIVEIRDGADKETENDTPDFYCTFNPPILPHEIKKLEAVFSDLYGSPKTLDDICLDEVIMAPSMIEPIIHHEKSRKILPIFVVHEEWAFNGECGNESKYCTDYLDARMLFLKLLENMTSNYICDWMHDKSLQTDADDNFYECWIDGDYTENHYRISLQEYGAIMSPAAFGKIGRQYIDEGYREDIAAQVEEWDEYVALTDEQKADFVRRSDLPERVQKALGRNDSYWESYWETVSEVSYAALKEYSKMKEEQV